MDIIKKKLAVIVVLVGLVCGATACGGITHCKECDDKIYKEGYCEYHYYLNTAKDTIDSAGKDVFDSAKDKINGFLNGK